MTYAYYHIFHILDFKTATIIKGTQSISILLVACIMRRFQNQPDVACKRGLIIVFSACNKGNRRRLQAGKLGLEWQNNNFARSLRFFVYSLVVAARQRRENP